MAAPAAVALVHATLQEIARVYPRGLLRWVRARRTDLKELLFGAEQRVESAAQAWRPNYPETEEALQDALDGLRWAYAEAIAAYHVRAAASGPAPRQELSSLQVHHALAGV